MSDIISYLINNTDFLIVGGIIATIMTICTNIICIEKNIKGKSTE